MPDTSKEKTNGSSARAGRVDEKEPRSMKVLRRGLKDIQDAIDLMGYVAQDAIDHRLTPAAAQTAINAIGKQMKALEMKFRHGTQGNGGGRRVLSLTRDDDESSTDEESVETNDGEKQGPVN